METIRFTMAVRQQLLCPRPRHSVPGALVVASTPSSRQGSFMDLPKLRWRSMEIIDSKGLENPSIFFHEEAPDAMGVNKLSTVFVPYLVYASFVFYATPEYLLYKASSKEEFCNRDCGGSKVTLIQLLLARE